MKVFRCLTLLTAVLLAATACDLGTPKEIASHAPGLPAKVLMEVDFRVVAVDDKDNILEGETADVAVNAYDIEGRQALYRDKESNEFVPGPQILPMRFLPWEYTATIGDERLVKVALEVTHRATNDGDGIYCRVFTNVTGNALPTLPENIAFASFPGQILTVTCSQSYIAR